jgi:hypothetical protein
MRTESLSFQEAEGIWDAPNIIIKRTVLKSMEHYAGTLLHEIAHAKSGADDVTREFEMSLTDLLGKTGSHINGPARKRSPRRSAKSKIRGRKR